MQKVINAAIIQDRNLVILRKEKKGKSIWILPGGKPEAKEADLTCLIRELSEELPFLKLTTHFYYYGSFEGISPNRNIPILTEVYMPEGIIDMNLKISSNSNEPIRGAGFMDYPGLIQLPLSETTIKIIESLKTHSYL